MKKVVFIVQILIACCLRAAFAGSHSLPQGDPAELDVWPNQTSRANSDSWLAEHHDQIRKMHPRLLVVNFSQEARPKHIEELTRGIVDAVAEASRYHGYKNSNAPVFLDYQIFKIVDLREPGKPKGNSSLLPLKAGITNT